MRRAVVVLTLLLAGCAAQQTLESANKALEGATVAEKKLADSGSAALGGVAAVTSRLAETGDQLTSTLATVSSTVAAAQPALREATGVLANVRARLEQPIVPLWVHLAFVGLGAGILATFVHNVLAHRKHRKLLMELRKPPV